MTTRFARPHPGWGRFVFFWPGASAGQGVLDPAGIDATDQQAAARDPSLADAAPEPRQTVGTSLAMSDLAAAR